MTNVKKTALITGGGSGLGRETALLFFEEGFNVVIAGRNQGNLKETLDLAGPAAERGLAVPTDVTDAAAVKRLFAAVREKFGRLDFLFNNAGCTGIEASGRPLVDIAVEDWRKVIDTNLTGTFLCAQEAVRIMMEQNPQGGRIINNGSIAAQSPRVNAAAYTASKSGVTGLTKSISLDYRRYHIACGQIDIGNADTKQASRHGQGSLQSDGEIRKEALMSVKDVAQTLLFMANLPLDANVQHITILATQMPFIGRG